MLSRLAKPDKFLFFISLYYHFPVIFMATSLHSQALTKKSFSLGKTFTTVFTIQEFAKKAFFRFFMKAYLLSNSFLFSTFHSENLFLTGLTLDPSREILEDELWYIQCLTVIYATKLIVPVTTTQNICSIQTKQPPSFGHSLNGFLQFHGGDRNSNNYLKFLIWNVCHPPKQKCGRLCSLFIDHTSNTPTQTASGLKSKSLNGSLHLTHPSLNKTRESKRNSITSFVN